QSREQRFDKLWTVFHNFASYLKDADPVTAANAGRMLQVRGEIVDAALQLAVTNAFAAPIDGRPVRMGGSGMGELVNYSGQFHRGPKADYHRTDFFSATSCSPLQRLIRHAVTGPLFWKSSPRMTNACH